MNDNFTANENNGLFDGVDLEKENKNYFSNFVLSTFKKKIKNDITYSSCC